MTGRYLRTLSIALGLFMLLTAWPGRVAYAEVATTKQNTRVMQRKGERSRVLKRLPPGKRVKVLKREGRWAQIRVDGQTGWVKSSSLSRPKRAAKRRNTRFGRKKDDSAPGNRVGADAVEGKDAPPDKGDKASGDDDDDDASDDDDDDGDDDDDDDDDGDDDDDEAVLRPDVKRTAAKSALRRLDQAEGSENATDKDSSRKRDDGDDDDDDDSDGDDDDDDDDDDDIGSKSANLNLSMVVKADKVVMRRSPNTESKKLDTLYKGAMLVVLKRSPDRDWYFVENSNGEQGWIQASGVRIPGEGFPTLMVRTRGFAGYTNMSQEFNSDGQLNYDLGLYNITTGAASVQLGGDLLYHATPWVVIGGDLAYTNTYSNPGIQYQDINGNQTQTPFMIHEVGVGALVGVDFQSAMGILAYARAGYHYSRFGVSDYDNPEINLARLPSEILNGLVVGGRLEIERLAGPLGVRLGGDVIVPMVTTRIQTAGLQDGDLVTAEGFWGSANLIYRLAAFDVQAGYRFAFQKTIWEGVSQRPTGALRASFRKDYTHMISVGVGKAF